MEISNKKFCIVIPTIVCKDYLLEALDWYTQNMKNTLILVVDNGNQQIPDTYKNVFIFKPESNLGVAGSWNFLLWRAFALGHEYVLVLNDDIILQRFEPEIDALIDKFGSFSFLRPQTYYNWSAFVISKTIFDKVGLFDINFKKCFFEDNDYEYRMKLAGVKIQYCEQLNPQVYRNSQTIERNPRLGGYLENRELYIKKWGGLPSEETFKTAYNVQ